MSSNSRNAILVIIWVVGSAILGLLIISIFYYITTLPIKSTDQYMAERGELVEIVKYFSAEEEKGIKVTYSKSFDNLEYDQYKFKPLKDEEKLTVTTEVEGQAPLEYEWSIFPANPAGIEKANNELKTTWHMDTIPDGWWATDSDVVGKAGIKSVLIPTNQNAVPVHIELGLRLPENFPKLVDDDGPMVPWSGPQNN
jgi:hypothetical protein